LIISIASIFGVALGSFLAGEFTMHFGRRKVMLVANIAIVFFSLISIIPMFLTIFLSRFFFSVSVGLIIVASLKILVETIPAPMLGYGFG
jgi:predicted MFS family arabinose efflux permease